MIKIIVLVVSLFVGGGLGFYFDQYLNNIGLDILVGFLFFLAAIICIASLFFIILFLLTFFENKNKERLYQSPYFRRVLLAMDSLLFSLFNVKVKAHGKELLSRLNQYVIVCNHRSNLDSLIIDKYLSSFPLSFITKDSLFKIPFVGKIIHGCAYVKLVRTDVNQEYVAFNKAINMLTRIDKPLSIGIFPEGTRNKNNDEINLLDFKPGSFHIAKKSNKPIVIMAISGSKKVNENLLFKRHIVYLEVLEIIDPNEYKDKDVAFLADYARNKITAYLKEKNNESCTL